MAPKPPNARHAPAKPGRSSKWACYHESPDYGLQDHAESAQNRVPDAGEPSADRAHDARVVGRYRHRKAPARGVGRSTAVDLARRTALRERPHPHGPRAEQGLEGRGREV